MYININIMKYIYLGYKINIVLVYIYFPCMALLSVDLQSSVIKYLKVKIKCNNLIV